MYSVRGAATPAASGVTVAFGEIGSKDVLTFTPDTLARLRAGGDVEFDVYARSSVDDVMSFTVGSPTPKAITDAALARHKLMKHMNHPGTGGTTACRALMPSLRAACCVCV